MSDVKSHNWFPTIRLNYAENILYLGDPATGQRSTLHKEDDRLALTEVREGCRKEEIRYFTWKDLRDQTRRVAAALKVSGVRKGDRIAVVASNSVDTLVAFLAATSLGGLFSSSSTDMGVKGILDRLLQVRPKWVFMDDVSVYNGKQTDLRTKMRDVVNGMEGVQEFQGIVSQPRFPGEPLDVSSIPKATILEEFLERGASSSTGELTFEALQFSDPFLIVYSSGTTGAPKCIVHSVGGYILSTQKESRLHRSLDETSKKLQFTTTGWIMYLANLQALMMGGSAVLYDGSPFLPDLTTFMKLIGEQRVTHFGTSARYLQELEKNKIIPREITNLDALEVVTTTGMVLSEALFEWFYDVAFPSKVHLDNISGGTDIAGAFATGIPINPVYVGGCQGICLGTPVKVYDSEIEGGPGVKGREVDHGVPGELVADASFPNMPIEFWGDEDGKKYFESYFAKYDDVWVHGDYIMIHPVTKQVTFLGRADGVLNPGGVRFGSAEIYNVLDKHFAEQIQDSICVGQRRPQDTDEAVMLFVLMRGQSKLTRGLEKEVRTAIRKELSPRHVPKYIFQTPEIPVSHSWTPILKDANKNRDNSQPEEG